MSTNLGERDLECHEGDVQFLTQDTEHQGVEHVDSTQAAEHVDLTQDTEQQGVEHVDSTQATEHADSTQDVENSDVETTQDAEHVDSTQDVENSDVETTQDAEHVEESDMEQALSAAHVEDASAAHVEESDLSAAHVEDASAAHDVGVDSDTEIDGKCCFCGDACNPASQACKPCMRSPMMWYSAYPDYMTKRRKTN